MTWPATYTNIAFWGATDNLIGETAAGAGVTGPITTLAYKGSDGKYHIGSNLTVEDSGGPSTSMLANAFSFNNASLNLLTMSGTVASFGVNVATAGNLEVYGSTTLANASGAGILISIVSSNPRFTWDTNDYYEYVRASNRWDWKVAGTTAMSLAAAGLTLTAPLALASGGTGSGTAAGARTNLDLVIGISGNVVPKLDGAAPTWAAGATFGGLVTTSTSFQATGISAPGGTGGCEIYYNAGMSTILSYNRTGSTLQPLEFQGSKYHMLVASLGNYANDAAAAAGGVAVGQLYRNGSIMMIRVA